MFKTLSLKNKLLLAFLAVGLIPLTAGAIYSYIKSAKALELEATQKLQTVRILKKKNLESFIHTLKDQIITMARQENTKNAFLQFDQGFRDYITDHNLSPEMLSAGSNGLQKYYENQFDAEFRKRNDNESANVSKLLDLNPTQLAMQTAYISKNPNSLGSKHLMDAPDQVGTYNKAHAIYHANFREFSERFSLYDIFLVDGVSGNIIYSVFKELDFATSLKTGAYSDSGLASAFKKAMEQVDPNAVVVTDYQKYLPSYNFPAMFIAVPIWINGSKKGTLVFQMNLDRINSIINERIGNAKTQDVYLVGPDHLMRTDSLLDKENHNVASSFRVPQKGSVKIEAVNKALQGEESNEVDKDMMGNDSLVSYGPFEFLGLRWAMVATYHLDEAFASIYEMRIAISILILVSITIIVLLVLALAKNLSGFLLGVSTEIAETANQTATASHELTSASSSLSEGATESAASLQETVASLEELSSMVKLNADHADEANKLSQKSLESASKGEGEISKLIEAMSSMSQSSKKIEEIITVIDGIAFQTNLLALNAAVEAARAGDQGKGFAVVAEAVRTLAQSSAEAAKEINTLIKDNVEKTEHGVHVADVSGAVLKEIVSEVKRVASLNNEISAASKEQANGIEQITRAMNQLDQAIQSNASSSQEVASSAEEMTAQAECLSQSVGQLRQFISGQDSTGNKDNPNIQKETRLQVVS